MKIMLNMKRSSLFAVLFALPLAASAQFQFPVFTDNFANGSTTNQTSTPGGTPYASFTSYDIASSKTATPSPASGHLKIGLSGGTTSGFWELQAVFASSPVSLVTVGDFINVTYTFTNSTGSLLAGGAASYIVNGLYNSGGSVPVAGKLSNSGLTTSTGSPYATGNCANWQGYASRISNAGGSEAYTRPVQNAGNTTSANQDLIGNSWGSGAYNNPGGVVFDVVESNAVALVSGSAYTVSYTIALTAAGTITVTNVLYNGAGTGGSIIFSQTNTAATTNVLTTSFDSLSIGARNSGTSFNPVMDIGNISVSSSIYGAPGPGFDVTGGGSGCTGSAFLVGLNGSVTTNVYFLYTNGVANGQMQAGTGSAISFGPQTAAATYTVQASNTLSTFTGFMSGNAVISFFSAPIVTTQPSPLVVANNSAGVFQVKASGGGLTFQWYRNGVALTNGGEFSGCTTSNLLINPATAADAATTAQGYYCLITDACSFQTVSSTNSLTLDTPANLVWQGGNPNANWDLNTTPNFTNSSGTAVVFHAGDNVTFDDSSTNPAVNIIGSYVAPGVITESAAQNYSFTAGSAALIGGGSLVMNGTGILTISNANAFTGGATLNSGNVTIRTINNPLGTGPIAMAGGTLEVPFAVGSTAGLTNTINTVANSTLQFDQTGTYAMVLNGTLSGSSSATLNIFNNDAATANNRLRLYGIFTNNANLILSSGGSEIEFAPYHSSGNQVYNGVISGSSGHIVARNAGNAIFSGQNTFNDSGTTVPTGYSLFMSSGNIGFGADSVSTTPPTIDSSPAGTGNIGINVGTEGGNCSFFAYGGAHTVGNPILYTSATNTVTVTISGSNNLTFSGSVTLSGADNTGTNNRAFSVSNTGATTFAGVVGDAGLICGIIKNGAGALYVNGTNTYTGPTTNNVGLLAGSGSIAGPVFVQTNGSIGGGSTSAIGTLTVNNSLTVNGNVFIRVNKSLSPAQSNDMISVSGTLANIRSGTVTVTNLGPALQVGDTFTLFNQALTGGATLSVTGGGMVWTNMLAINGTIQALAAVSTIIPLTNSPAITNFSLSGANVVLSGTNGQTGATAYLLATTNLASARNQWRTIATNVLGGGNYTFIGTNAVSALAQRFYMLSSTNYNP